MYQRIFIFVSLFISIPLFAEPLLSPNRLDEILASMSPKNAPISFPKSRRIPNNRIESALKDYPGGDTLQNLFLRSDECGGGEDIMLLQQKGGVVKTGMNTLFLGDFFPVMGLHKGMSMQEVIALLGTPLNRWKNQVEYHSERSPYDPDGGYYDEQWRVNCQFIGGKLDRIVIRYYLDDC